MQPPSRRALAALLVALLATAASAQEPWEAKVERARKQQDREINSARVRKKPLDALERRYVQQVVNEASALNYYLLGRIYHAAEKPNEAVEALRKALQRDPAFWYADNALAQLHFLVFKRPADAKTHVLRVLGRKPDHIPARQLLARILIAEKDFPGAYEQAKVLLRADPRDWDARRIATVCLMAMERHGEARTQLRSLIMQFPRDVQLRAWLVECHLELEDWRQAISDLRQLERALPKDPQVLWQLGLALFEYARAIASEERLQAAADDDARKRMVSEATRWLREAASVLGKLDAIESDKLQVMDLLQLVFAFLGEHQQRVAVMERMLPVLEKQDPTKAAEMRKALGALKEALKAGQRPAGPQEPTWERNPLTELIERCIHPDAEVRRKALHEYYKSDLPFVDPVIHQRYHPDNEPDAECRLLVVRILGKYRVGEAEDETVRLVARLVGFAIEDPDPRVGKVAAEELGHIGAKVGILFILPDFMNLRLDPLPADDDARSALEAQYNANRLALVALTGRSDVPAGRRNWVAADEMAANREDWRRWLDGPAGVAVRLEALQGVREHAVDAPERQRATARWVLRYVLADVLRPEPAPASIALETYRVIRDAVRADPGAAQDPIWEGFPMIPDEQVTEAGIGSLRERVLDWWRTISGHKKPAAPGK